MRSVFAFFIIGLLIYLFVMVSDAVLSLIVGLLAGMFQGGFFGGDIQKAFSMQAAISKFWPLIWGFSAFLGTLIGYRFLLKKTKAKKAKAQNYNEMIIPIVYVTLAWFLVDFIATSFLLYSVIPGIVNIHGPLWPFVIFQLNLSKEFATFVVILFGVVIGTIASFYLEGKPIINRDSK